MKKAWTIVLILLVLGAAIAGFFVWKHQSTYISRKEATQLALEHVQLQAETVKEIDVEFENNGYSAWYEIDIESHGVDYEVSIDAVSGEILASSSKNDH